METGKQGTTTYAGHYARPRVEGDKKKDEQYDKDIKRLLKQLGLDEEEEDRLFWLRGFSPGYSPMATDRGMGLSGSYSPMPTSRNSQVSPYTQQGANSNATPYTTPMSSFTRTREGRYMDTGHNADISIQYVAPDGGRYNMNVRTKLDNTGDALCSAMLGFYGMIAADAKGGSYKSGDGKSYRGRGGGSYAGGKGGN
jgi:hypothetical protein